MKPCVIIPAYNEAGRIVRVLKDVISYISEVIVVDDGSLDDTGKEITTSGLGVKLIRHTINQGKGAALKTGIGYAISQGYDVILTMDGDGQHAPADIPKFLEKFENTQSDIILGCRMEDTKDMPFLRYIVNNLMSLLISWITGHRIRDTQCGYRLFKTEIIANLELKSTNFDFESEILIQASRHGFKIREVPIKTIYGDEKSKIKKGKDTYRFFKLILKLLLLNHG